MKKAAVFYNPLAGGRRERRLRDVEAVVSVLRGAGIEASAAPTGGPSQTIEQTKEAILAGCDTVFACGGDGTIHDVLQGLAGTGTALAIIPMGTANALAHDLRLPFSCAEAARATLSAEPRRIALGRAEYRDLSGQPASRFFIVTAGVGVDAHLFYTLNAVVKGRLGMIAYYAQAVAVWLTHRMKDFCVAAASADSATSSSYDDVSQLLAVRIGNFGGVLRELAPGAALERNDLRLVLFRTQSRLAYLSFILRGLVGGNWQTRRIELLHAAHIECGAKLSEAATPPRIFVEADGELLGTLPAKISIVPDALVLLAPPPQV